jgi:hypothetical protein
MQNLMLYDEVIAILTYSIDMYLLCDDVMYVKVSCPEILAYPNTCIYGRGCCP